MVELPGGQIKNSHSQKTIRIEQTAYSKEEIENINIYNSDRERIKLKEIADISYGFDGEEIKPFFNGKPCSYIAVYIRPRTSIIIDIKTDIVVTFLSKHLDRNGG